MCPTCLKKIGNQPAGVKAVDKTLERFSYRAGRPGGSLGFCEVRENHRRAVRSDRIYITLLKDYILIAVSTVVWGSSYKATAKT